VADQVLEQAQAVASWCRTAASRISRYELHMLFVTSFCSCVFHFKDQPHS
jgi:hypothetical protein